MENERLARVEEQLKWMGPRVERIEGKIDRLIEKSEHRWGKILGVAMVISFIATALVEIARAGWV